MKRILFPTDFSSVSLNAFGFALDLARNWGAAITTLHAVYPTVTRPELQYPFSEEAPALLELEQYRQAAELMRQTAMREHHAEVPVDHMIEENFASDAIIHAAGQLPADAIVMGSRGGGGLGDQILGTTTTSVIDRSGIPVFTVPEGHSAGQVSRVAFSADFLTVNESDIDKAVDIAAIYGAGLTVFCIDHQQDPAIQEKAEHWRGRFSRQVAFEVIYNPYILDGIVEYARPDNVDLLLMKTQRHGFFHQLFRISYSRQMTMHSSVPVCIIK